MSHKRGRDKKAREKVIVLEFDRAAHRRDDWPMMLRSEQHAARYKLRSYILRVYCKRG